MFMMKLFTFCERSLCVLVPLNQLSGLAVRPGRKRNCLGVGVGRLDLWGVTPVCLEILDWNRLDAFS